MDPPRDASTVSGYLALPVQQAAPGVLVLHPWWGLNAFMRSFCDRLAAEGFTVFAPDLYDGRVAETIPEAEAASGSLDSQQASRTIGAAEQLLLQHPRTRGDRLGVVGFSMGAAWALELEENIAAAVVFYGTNAAEDIPSGPPLQGHFADQDPYEPLEDVRALEAALDERGKSIDFHYYPGTRHWFFESNRPEFNPQAAEMAWKRTVDFLKKELE